MAGEISINEKRTSGSMLCSFSTSLRTSYGIFCAMEAERERLAFRHATGNALGSKSRGETEAVSTARFSWYRTRWAARFPPREHYADGPSRSAFEAAPAMGRA